MSAQPNKVTIGERVALDKIESSFQAYWRETGDAGSNQAVLKASTVNLIIAIEDKTLYDEVLSGIHDIISHHPGRIIIAFIDHNSELEEIEAHISVYSLKSEENQMQISAELALLKTGQAGAHHLAGTILPLLLADLPVYFWCTSKDLLTDRRFITLFQFTDRLILSTPKEYETAEEMAKTVKSILAFENECKISDISWSQLTDWREALAQFFDAEKNLKYLNLLDEVEITYSGDKMSNQTFLMAGWLSAGLKPVMNASSVQDDPTIYFRRQNERLSIKIRRKSIGGQSGLYKIKLYAEEHERSVIFTATQESDGSIQTSVQRGGSLNSLNYITATRKNNIELLCAELDFLQQDRIYLNACQKIVEYFHEN